MCSVDALGAAARDIAQDRGIVQQETHFPNASWPGPEFEQARVTARAGFGPASMPGCLHSSRMWGGRSGGGMAVTPCRSGPGWSGVDV